MRATIFYGPGDVRVEQVPDPRIELPTDAVVRVTHACICGSDLWPYRGVGGKEPGTRIGHELMGRVEEVGAGVVAGRLDPSPVLDMTVGLDGVPDGYAAMDARRAIKVMVRL